MQLTVEACPGRAYVAINDSSVDVLGQVTGDTQLSLLSAKKAGHTGLTGSRRPFSLLRLAMLLRGMSYLHKNQVRTADALPPDESLETANIVADRSVSVGSIGIAPLARQMPIDQNPGSERSGAEHCDQYRERAAIEIHQSRWHSQER
jgi:hypothetical protein